jgi:hypothetical protein
METEWFETDYKGYWLTKNADFKRVWKRKEVFHKGTFNKKTGYIMISLGRKIGKITLHSLMAKTFLPNPNNLRNIDHINRIKTDNRLENLRWFSQSDNMLNRGKIRGIAFIEDRNYWVAKSGQDIIGYFKTEDEARACKFGWLKAKGIDIEDELP